MLCKLVFHVHSGHNPVCIVVVNSSHGRLPSLKKCKCGLLGGREELAVICCHGRRMILHHWMQKDRFRRMRTKDKAERCFFQKSMDLRAGCIRECLHRCIPALLMFGGAVLKAKDDDRFGFL